MEKANNPMNIINMFFSKHRIINTQFFYQKYGSFLQTIDGIYPSFKLSGILSYLSSNEQIVPEIEKINIYA